MKNQLLTFLLTFVMFTLISCEGSRSRESARFSYDRIKTLIDAGYLDDAEYELQEHLAMQPNDDEARVLLASVSVTRAGISLKDYFRLYRVFQAPRDSQYALFRDDAIRQAEKMDKNVAKTLKGIDELYTTVADVRARFAMIQVLNQQQAIHMHAAIIELNRLQSKERGALFYRGIVKLIYFRYLLENDLFFAIHKKKICKTSLRSLRDQVESFREYFLGLLNDLGYGYPKQQESIQKFSRDLSTGLNLVAFSLASGDQDRPFSALIKQAWPQGQIKCDF